MESACDGCIGLGSSPATGSVSLRSFNRNWKGRSGTVDDSVYLASPETCIAAALTGQITDPVKLGEYPVVNWPASFIIDDSMIIPPHDDPGSIEVIRGPNIKPLPKAQPLATELKGEVLIKVGDNTSTDAIMPAGPKILPLRSNIPAISEYVFAHIDPGFAKRAKEKQGGFIIGGDNYGQGSSREHAALAPLYLGIKAVIARSFARIHKANLVNFGILPLELMDPASFDTIKQGDILECKSIRELIQKGSDLIPVNIGSAAIKCGLDISSRQREIILAGGLLNFTKSKHG